MSSYDPYSTPSYGNSYDPTPLQFYSSQPSHQDPSSSYYTTGAGRPRLEGQRGVSGNMSNGNGVGAYGSGVGGSMVAQGGFWSAFGTGGFEGEPPLMEELGINFHHIKNKSIAVLNPFLTPEPHLMDDADLAGPLIFCFGFGMFLLFSGKPQFGYIYGLALLGDFALYFLLNLMSETGIDAYRVASVLGYCLLPLVLLSLVTVVVSMDGALGYLLFFASIIWCSYSASGIFVSVLRMSEQRMLVAYPVALFYTTFALLSVFDAGTGGLGASRA